jgi:Eco57I restriction-modification methylase/restriction endonuclease TaqI-like protein
MSASGTRADDLRDGSSHGSKHRQRRTSPDRRVRTALETSEQNAYQARTSASKLRGQYYTPDALVGLMLDTVSLSDSQWVIDPSCGDGSFFRGVAASVKRRFPDRDPQALAEHWAGRILGFDINVDAVEEARLGLQAAFREHFGVEVPVERLRIFQGDVLRFPSLSDLLQSVGVAPLGESEDLLVIGNPPYVEAKRLPRAVKDELKARYPDAISGAPDLFLYFLHVCLGWLRDGDRLAFVLPNKALVNSNARRIRERLLDEGRLERLWFATHTRLFGEAGVYPVILFAGGPALSERPTVEVTHLLRAEGGKIKLGETTCLDHEAYRRTRARVFYPTPEKPALRAALDRLLSGLEGERLEDVLDIRWSVSFHREGLRERYVTPHRPASPHARRFLGGGAFSGNGEVVRYGITWGGWWIDYDGERLREEGNTVPDLSLFERPKIAICQNGRTLRSALDEESYVLKDTFLCGVIGGRDHPLCRHPRALVGLLCSQAVHFFYSHVFYGGHVSGGYLHFLRSFLVDIPVGTWTDALAEEMAGLVRKREAAPPEDRLDLEARIEERVSQALALAPAERNAICEWTGLDPNWQARERVRGPGRPAPHGPAS